MAAPERVLPERVCSQRRRPPESHRGQKVYVSCKRGSKQQQAQTVPKPIQCHWTVQLNHLWQLA